MIDLQGGEGELCNNLLNFPWRVLISVQSSGSQLRAHLALQTARKFRCIGDLPQYQVPVNGFRLVNLVERDTYFENLMAKKSMIPNE